MSRARARLFRPPCDGIPFRPWLLGAACAVVCCAFTFAARADVTPLPHYFFDRFSSDSGLSSSNVLDAVQTRDGFLWLGTANGVTRFDGERFRSYAIGDLPAESVACLYQDRDGTLWAGTDRGVARMHEGAFLPAGLSDASVTCFAQDRDGTLWIGTNGAGLYAWTGTAFRSYAREPAMPSAHISCVHVDTAGRLWVGFLHSPGLVCRANRGFERFDTDERIAAEIHSICEGPDGTLWLGLTGPAVARLTNGRIELIGTAQGLRGTAVTSVRAAAGGGVWAVTDSPAVLYRIEGTLVTEIPGLPADSIANVCADREGNLWLAAREDGLVRAAPMPFQFQAPSGQQGGENIKRVAEDHDGNLWITNARGEVSRVSPHGAVTRFTRANGLPAAATFALPAHDGSIWLACGSLYRWTSGNFVAVPSVAGIQGMYEDRAGQLWVGCRSRGLVRLKDGRFDPILTSAGKPIEYATEFAETDDGTLYVGTWMAGIVSVKNGNTTVIDHRSGLPSDEVRAVHVDREGRLWVGMRRRGLAVRDRAGWWSSAELSAATGGHVAAILEDDSGQLWLGTPNGVMFASKDDWMAVARGQRPASILHLAGMADGNHVTPIPTGGNPVAWRSRSGTLLFATRTGVIAIDPARVPTNTISPRPHIDRAAVNGRWADRTAGLELPAGTRDLAIEYTAPTFYQNRRATFEYRLDGYDADWIDAGPRRVAVYSNLPPGRYEFQLRARNSDGVASLSADRLGIVQRPHYYQTPWFWAGAALAIGAAGVLLVRHSQRRLRQRFEDLARTRALERTLERERRRIAKNLHDELGASLTEIGLAIDLARRNAPGPPVDSELRTVRDRVRGMAKTLDTVVWSVNPANDSLRHLASYLSESFQDLARMASVRCRLETGEDPPPYPLTPDERAHIYLTAKEAMNNAIKHAHASEILLRMKMEEGRFTVSIEDDGGGFDPAAPAANTRNGLANMRSRIAELHGSLIIDSAPGRGTTIRLFVPFPRPGAHHAAPDKN